MKLIGLHGLPRSGKDTIAKALISRYSFERLAFADPLKEAAAILLNRPLAECHGTTKYGDPFDREAVMPEWGFSMRWFLQRFGTECLRDQIHPDFWITRMKLAIHSTTAQQQDAGKDVRMVITDVRFQNEVDMIRDRGGVMVHVRRPGLTGSSHVSDQLLACDFEIDNDGTLDELYWKADHLVTSIANWNL